MQGQTINGYTLKSRLGEGGMAEVWYAENEIGKPAAVKILNENLSRNTQIVERFHNEALVMVKLDHPNIRQVYGYGYIGNRHCIIMEYLDGDDLEALLKSGRHFTDEEVRRWWNQTVDALNYTHAMNIVHRDIKPSNLFLDKKGNIKLLDFGIAKVKESMSMTRTGLMMGTLMYMSPEQVKDPKRVGTQSDIYSLAVTFVHLLTGKPIYDCEANSEFDIQVSIVSHPVDLSAVPAAWQSFLKPYLEKDPDRRPALRHFEETLHTSPTATPTVVQPETTPSPEPTRVATSSSEAPHSGAAPLSSESQDKSKSKAGLWIGIGAAAVAVVVLLVMLLKPKGETEDFERYRARVEKQVADSFAMAKAQEQAEIEAQAKAEAEMQIKTESEAKQTVKQIAPICEEPRFSDRFKLPHGLKGYFDYNQAMACAKVQNKPLFVYFTAHGSANSREMETNVWNDPRVLKLLREEYVIAALYVDDKTQLPENEWYTSTYDGKVKKTIGRKNADFQLSEFDTNVQPYYCLLDHKGKLIIKPYTFNLDKEAFVQFLQKGTGKVFAEVKQMEQEEQAVSKTVEGVFSVSASRKVHFAKGNLQYQASTRKWRFAVHQWDCIQDSNENISDTYSGWIDLFGWGTGDNPTNTSFENADYPDFVDWGKNSISNGGGKKWRTLTKDEWDYVINKRSTSSSIRYAPAYVKDSRGIILFPDDWSQSCSLKNANEGGHYHDNRITNLQWDAMEKAGAIFLPHAGELSGMYDPTYSHYWSASSCGSEEAYVLCFSDGGSVSIYKSIRGVGYSVRLVCPAED